MAGMARDESAGTRLGYLVPEMPGQTHAFFWREVQALRAAGTEVTLLSTRRPPADACPHAFASDARAETIYLFPPGAGAAAWLGARPAAAVRGLRYAATLAESGPAERVRVAALLPIAAELCRVAAARDLTHVHIQSCATAAHLGAMARHMGGPAYSLTLHGHLPVYGKDHPAKIAEAAFVRTVTRPLQADVRQIAPAAHIPVISMGVDTEAFAPPGQPRDHAGPVRFLGVARLNRTKGHVHFLRALRRLLDEGVEAQYVVAGAGPEEPAIRAEIAALGLERRVEMLGAIPQDEVLRRLHAADCLVLTSYGAGEAAPVAVMEAMATGLPVICSVIGGTADMIEDGHDGLLVPQQDESAIAAAARGVARDPALRARLGAAARQRAVAEFDYRQKAARLLDEIAAGPA
jgi:glycosyltransferase involved in cell wall biosynthesis